MTRCLEFYEKFDRDGNFCGLSKSTVSQILSYKEILNDLHDESVDKKFAIANFTEGASRPLHKIRENKGLYNKVLVLIADHLKKGDAVSAGDVETWIALEEEKVEQGDDEHTCKACGDPIETPAQASIRELTTAYCKERACPHLKKREMNNTLACELADKVPGNLAACPLDEKKQEKPAPGKKDALSEEEYRAKYPDTAECLDSGCTKIKRVKPDLHICEAAGMRPENMLGKYPDGCHKKEPEPKKDQEEPPIEGFDPMKYPVEAACMKLGCTRLQRRQGEWANLRYCQGTNKAPDNLTEFPDGCPQKKTEDPAEEDDTPGYQEHLNKQLARCRQKKCPHLIDEEGDIMADCEIMANREDNPKTRWRRNDCPLQPEVPPARPGSTRSTMTVREGPKRTEASISLFDKKPAAKETRPFQVEMTRGQEPIIDQMIRYKIAPDESRAAQMAFDRGLQEILNIDIERIIQAEGAEGAEEEGGS